MISPAPASPGVLPVMSSYGLVQPAQHDGGNRQQEGEAGGRGALQAEEQAGRERGARSRYARHQRERLRGAHDQAVAQLQVGDRAVAGAAPVGDGQHDPQHDERAGDEPERAERRLDRVLEQEAEHADRDRRPDEVPAHPGVELPAQLGAPQARAPARPDAPEVTAEVDDLREHRAELHDRRESGPRVVPADERGDDPQVRRARDGQELGEPLDDPEDDRLEQIHGSGRLENGERRGAAARVHLR